MTQPANYYATPMSRPIVCELVGDYVWEMGADNMKHRSKYAGVFVELVCETEYNAAKARIVELEEQIRQGYGMNWRKRYARLHKIHVEDVRRRLEVRNFRAVNFSVAELGAALARKTTGKLPPPKENWGGVVMSALCLAEDAVKMLTAVRPHVPDEVQERMNLCRRRDSFYVRQQRLTQRIKEMRDKNGRG